VQETLLAIHNSRETWRRRSRDRVAARDRPLQADRLPAGAHGARCDRPSARRRRRCRARRRGALAAEARRDLFALLATLPDRFRLPILHVKLEGLSVAETAARTGLSESAVKIGIHRGLKRLALQARSRT
jgi:RNA polymerase sigma-70 factor (ECF subfamily)